MVELPPVETNLLGLVDGANQQPNPDCEQFDFGEGDFDIARDDQPLVQHSIEYFDQTTRAWNLAADWRRHRFAILWDFLARAIMPA